MRFLRAIVWWLRQVSGDAAYENYVRAALAGRAAAYPYFGGDRGKDQHSETREAEPALREGAGMMAPDAFYLDSLRRRYSRVSRCC